MLIENSTNELFLLRRMTIANSCGERASELVSDLIDFLKVVRLVFWSGVVGPGAHCCATRSKARLVSKSSSWLQLKLLLWQFVKTHR